MSDKKLPNPEKIQKEFEKFVKDKFGSQIQVISQAMPFAEAPQDNEERESNDQEKSSQSNPTLTLEFDLKPKDIKAYLDRYVIDQDDAKKALAIAVCDHYNQVASHQKNPQNPDHDNYNKQNVLITGPTGVGKTYMIKQIAKLIGVPFVKADATRFSETGYMGANVEDLIKDLVQQSDGDIEQAQYGIVYLDEADKLAAPSKGHGRDVSGRGVQLGLLKLMEETEVDLKSGNDPASQIQAFMDMQQKGKVEKQVINTKHILFIVSGAFTGLDKIVGKRLQTKQIGFGSTSEPETKVDMFLQEAKTEDFIEYGFEPEFVGRLPVRVACNHLDEDALYHILKDSEGSIIKQYINNFKAYDIETTFSDEAFKAIAAQAAKEKTGARSLMTVCERLFRDFKFELPSTDVSKLNIDKNFVENPQHALHEILATSRPNLKAEKKSVLQFEKDFSRKHCMNIKFTDEAISKIVSLCLDRSQGIAEFLNQHFLGFEHGLKLVQQNTGHNSFTLNSSSIDNPREALEAMIKESYN